MVNTRTGFITLSAVYCPPKHKISEANFTDFFKTLGNRFIAGGDWNAKHIYWGSRLTTSRGRSLKECLDSNHLLTLSTGSPTYWPSDPEKTPDLLDFFITKNVCPQYTTVESSLDGSSDHSPIILTISSIIPTSDRGCESLHNFKTDWNSFPEAFGTHLAEVFKPNEAQGDDDPDIDFIPNQDFQLSVPPSPTSPSEVLREIKNMNAKKAPGFNLITPRLLKELPKKCVVFLTNLFNATFRLSHFPNVWKVSQIIMIYKPGKPAHETSSYRPISLTPVLSKLWEKIFLVRLSKCINERDIIPQHQFGFRKHHLTVEQVHRVYDSIRHCLETKQYCSAAFLDIQQAFDRVWHKGLLCKVKKLLPHPIYSTISSYLENRVFFVKQGEARSDLFECLAGVPQGSVLGSVLYNIFTHDLPQSADVTIATYADDAAFLSSFVDPIRATVKLQKQLNDTHAWLNKWRIKASAPKCFHITFSLRQGDCPPVKLDNTILPQTNCVKYLGFLLDRHLTWKDHIKAKRDETNHRFRNLLWLLCRQSTLSTNNKLLIYTTIQKPIWIYGIQIWSTASKSNIMCLQRVQNNILRVIAGAPWFARNSEIHDYLGIPTVTAEIERYKKKYMERLSTHPNPLAYQLTTSRPVKRLKRAAAQSCSHSKCHSPLNKFTYSLATDCK
ncbi:unnamed protein product [Euphydryas editha]|uniref:Reverse transcriptase domain-containing protein n=1 Tax=Euphydryas editha TaxID=104508 RepID=A0AAU9U4W4_EUPED|nr:unnamed protein product [Euphydryas editha]